MLCSGSGLEELNVRPVQVGQLQQALHQPQSLAQRQVEQALEAQAELDAGIGKCLLATAFAAGPGRHCMSRSRQMVSEPRALSAAVVLRPVADLVTSLMAQNYLLSRCLCNKAHETL